MATAAKKTVSAGSEKEEVAQKASQKKDEEANEVEDEGEKNMDEILDELKEDEEEDGAGEEMLEEGENGEEGEDHEDDDMGEGSDDAGGEESKEEGEKTDKEESQEEGKTWQRSEETEKLVMDPSRGFLENEQDKMIAGRHWKYRMKITFLDFEARELNHGNIEKLVNISTSSALYFYKKNKLSGKKLGKMELFCSTQSTGQIAVEKALRLDISHNISLFIMRKVNMEEKELAYLKINPHLARRMRFPPLSVRQQDALGGNPSTRSVYVSNIPEGTSEELLQALFPCCVNVVKPEESEGSSTGTAILECINNDSSLAVMKSYIKVQIGANALPLCLCTDNKEASTLIDALDQKKKEEAKAEREKQQESREKKDGDSKSEDRDTDRERDRESRHSDRKSSSVDGEKYRKPLAYHPYPRGGSSYRPNRGGRYHPSDRYQDRGPSYADRRETEALKDQIAMLQENISMLTQSMNPMMMSGGGAMDGGGMSKRHRSNDSNRYGYSNRGDYSSSRYSSRDYGSSYGGSGSWSEGSRSNYEGTSRKRSYNWDDDYGGREYKKYY